MNTFHLECFLTVAETLNFAKAAQILNITQPAVTKNIKTLEDELNVRLFKRSTRNVELTQEGKELINDAQTIVQTSLRAINRYSGTFEENCHLSIGIRMTSHIKLLTKPVKDLLEIYPGCRPQIQLSSVQQLFRMLNEGEIDLIFDVRLDDAEYDGIEYTELYKEKVYCVCTEKFPLFNAESTTISQINSLDYIPLIFIKPPKIFRRTSDTQKRLIGNRNQSIVQFCSSSEEVSLLTEVGWGMAVVPEKIVPESPNLRKIPIVDCDVLSFGIYRRSSNYSKAADRFIEILKRYGDLMKF
ncbi:MAG: LysR family transcriptional regulator, partial [Oscillospiraceae bacterium]